MRNISQNQSLRRLLRVASVNRLARRLGKWVLTPRQYEQFEQRLPLIEPFDVSLPSGEVIRWIPQGDIVSKPIRFRGWDGYEGHSLRLFYDLALRASVCLDVGAYLGYFALVAAGARPGNRAYAFECVPKLAEACRQIATANPRLSVELVEAAVSKASGVIDLYLSENPMLSDTSTNPKFRSRRQAVQVTSVCIDDFVLERQLDAVDLLKIDTETTEPDVLAGARVTIQKFRPTMMVEVLNVARVDELNAFLREHSYLCAWVSGSGVLGRDSVQPDMSCKFANYLFYPSEANSPVAKRAAELVTRSRNGIERAHLT